MNIIQKWVLLCLILLVACAKPKQMPEIENVNFDEWWKKIDSLEAKALPRSALDEVEKLYFMAKSQKEDGQTIKAILYKNKYIMQLEEEAAANALLRIEKEIEDEQSPSLEVLHSVLGELYLWYAQNNAYQFQNRTETLYFNPLDLKTWSLERLLAKSSEHYLKSVNKLDLKQVDIEYLDPILTKSDEKSKKYIGNVQELLFFRAIEHFKNSSNLITEPVYKFRLDQKEAYGAIEEFIDYKFETEDQVSQIFRASLLFQQALSHYLDMENQAGLLYTNLNRLNFVNQHSSHPEKDDLYIKALENLIDKYGNQEEIAEAYYQLGAYWQKVGSQNNTKDELVKAAEYCKKGRALFPDSYGASLCNNLLSSLETKSLILQTEEVQSPDYPVKFFVRYRNLSKLHFKLLSISIDQMRELDHLRNNEKLKFLNKMDALKSWETEVPSELDYRTKSAEIISDKIKPGSYLILVSDTEKFTDDQHAVGFAFFHVSRLSYSFLNEFKQGSILVTDSYSGHPIKGAIVEFFESYYDPSIRTNNYRVTDTKTTDARGYAASAKLSDKSLIIKIKNGQDELDLRWNHYANRWYENHSNQFIHFFTDRAIYRPGQIVYFKALLMESDQYSYPKLIANKKIQVKLMDANYQEKQKQTFVTNEYGSFHGSFISPESGLTGQMSLMAEGLGAHYFQVEEYKRPKFEVVLDPSNKSYILGDSVIISGLAKSYAGSAISNAKIQYQVKRQLNWAWRGYQPTAGMMIAHGSASTNDEGKFEIQFPAAGEPNQSDHVFYSFNVNIDVTDDAGETRSASKAYEIGQKPFRFEVNTVGELDKASLKSLEITAINYNDQKTAVKGTYQIIKLQEPKTVYRNRYWSHPDTILTDEKSWNKDFPFESFADKLDRTKWEEVAVVQEGIFETSIHNKYETEAIYEAGVYKISISAKNENGVELKKEFIFSVFDYTNGSFPKTKELFTKQNKLQYEPGETAIVKFGTPHEDLMLWYTIEKHGKLIESNWLKISPSNELKIPVLEKDRGGFIVYINYIKNNRFSSDQLRIEVPWSNKELNLEILSFRDKLIPGQQEEWQLKIKGSKGEHVAAELLASMYDASLDAFASHRWERTFKGMYHPVFHRQVAGFRAVSTSTLSKNWNSYAQAGQVIQLPRINFFNLYQYFLADHHPPIMMRESRAMKSGEMSEADAVQILNDGTPPGTQEGNANFDSSESVNDENSLPEKQDVSFSPRVNLNETVFFYPDLKTDKVGNVVLSFKMNEALTRWKLLLFAHGKDLEYAFDEKELVTQKDLMVFPNIPRFFRQGDQMEITSKVVNLSKNTITVDVSLDLEDAISGVSLDNEYYLQYKTQKITIRPGLSQAVQWPILVPISSLAVLKVRTMAKSGVFTDGEEVVIPVVSNRMLVTESLPLALKGNETKSFEFKSMKKSFESNTMQPHLFTLEYTSNPIWYAIQALPYIMEFPHECSEQLFNRYYANAIASYIVVQNPKIKAVFDQWKSTDKEALLSNLSKNADLKSALLEETPWVLDAISEEEQKRNIALLFDLNQMRQSQESVIKKLTERQLSNGGFAWFSGGKDNPYISQYILEGFGHLLKLGVLDLQKNDDLRQVLISLTQYVDERIAEKYKKLLELAEESNIDLEKDHLDAYAIHYLYVRSFFSESPMNSQVKTAHEYYMGQAEKYWIEKGIYLEAMMALALGRNNNTASVDIMKSLMERAIQHDELGMYWKQNAGYHWHQLPVERQALLIEAAYELGESQNHVDDMKTWLLKMKQTSNWKTTKATSAAIYSLLLDGNSMRPSIESFDKNKPVSVKLGEKAYSLGDFSKQAGTGYIKTSFTADQVTRSMAQIEVKNSNDHINWGAVYWQYFEDLDKIQTFEETPLTIKKQVLKVVTGDRGDQLVPITEGTGVKIGDKLKIRIELRVDRPMEFIHMKDMRASGLEPLNVISGYKWQGGLGYYESTKDLASHFFIDYLPVGTFVFEYPVRVFHKGNFSNGITSIQSMYAPEFSSHSEGIRIEIK